MTVATTSTALCNASETSARLPIRTPTTNFAAAMLALAAIEIAATRTFPESTWETASFMGADLAADAPP